MNKKYIFFITAILGIYNSANAFTPWWEQDTICRINSNNCYSSATKGINMESWDDTSKCWGKKIICAKALALKNSSDNTEVAKKDISNTSYVNADFDTNKLSKSGEEYCYGQRKTKSNNTQAMVNGTYVKVWCPGILDNADDSTQNGEITFGTQPTCNMLAEKNYIAVIDDKNKCYGKKLSTSYYIDCSDSTNDKPSQLIVLNDADINAPQGNTPQTMADAKAKFQDMHKTSTDRKSVAFKNTTN